MPVGLMIGLAIFLTSLAAVPERFGDYQVIRLFNGFARHSALLDRTIHALTARDLLEGVVFVALLWWIWFAGTGTETRARLLTGAVAASCAGVLSRVLQIVLPTHLRPLHTPELGFVRPFGVEPDTLNHFNSFPSDHGALFFGIALVIFQLRPRLGVAAFIWAIIVDVARVYEGFHFPSDILGSIGLAVMVVTAFRNPLFDRFARYLVQKAYVAPAWFYMLAFLASYQIATLFDDVREIGRGFASIVLHHDLFGG